MKRLGLHAVNWLGYFIGIDIGSTLFSKIWWKLWKFVSDEDYASNHPKMYLLKFVAVLLLGFGIGMAIVWYPLSKLMEWIDSKIDTYADEKEWD